MRVWVLHRWDTEYDKFFCGVYSSSMGIRKAIFDWADYIVEDAKQHGNKDDIIEAEKEATELKAYYTNYDFSLVSQRMFAKGFEVERIELRD